MTCVYEVVDPDSAPTQPPTPSDVRSGGGHGQPTMVMAMAALHETSTVVQAWGSWCRFMKQLMGAHIAITSVCMWRIHVFTHMHYR